MRPLPYHDQRHQLASQFLVEEAHLLDTAQFEAWLELMHPQVTYRMPARVTTARDTEESSVQTIDHFLEDHYSLRKRVERLGTKYAWAEDPQSRTRHHVSNFRTFVIDELTMRVESALLLYRSRGDRNEPSVLSAGRSDVIVESGQGYKLKERTIEIDEAVLHTQNLAVFL